MISTYFIKRPVLSIVIAILISLAGIASLTNIPLEQYPSIAPPSVSIRTNLPGANAQNLESSTTQIIEQGLTGIDNLKYFSSSSDSDGNVSITATFESGTDPNIAQMQVQNKLQTTLPLLPPDVQKQGLFVNKSNNNFLLTVALVSNDDKTSFFQLSDIISSQIRDQIARINGVGDVTVFGPSAAMRIWLDPFKLVKYNLSISEVQNAISDQNVDITGGQIGGSPSLKNQQINAVITSTSRLKTAKEFENIIMKTNTNFAPVLLKDIATVEIGEQSYNIEARYNRHPASGMAVILASGANAIKTADAVKKKISELTKNLPKGVEVFYPYDSTPFIKISIKNVVHTLFEAILLVFCVMFLFLQNWRATLIPTIAVPVVLLGTVSVLFAMGFTINTLTMFATVLAIGLLVDDAIVVVENVERIMEEENLSPFEATKKTMSQISGALFGIAVVLSAVFIPMAFFPGSSGGIYRQFSVTIVSSMFFSVIVAIILTPTLCIILLKKEHKKNKFFMKFNEYIEKIKTLYLKGSSNIVSFSLKYLAIYGVLSCFAIFLLTKLPKSFLPNEDQGTLYVMLQAQEMSTMERTLNAMKEVENYFLETEKNNIEGMFSVIGYSSQGRAQNAALGFIRLKDWQKRNGKKNTVQSISERATVFLQTLKNAKGFTYFPPPIRELGNASGFDAQIIDLDGVGRKNLLLARNLLLKEATANPLLTGVRPNGLSDLAQLKVDINYNKAIALGLSPQEVALTLQTAFGSNYIGNFLDRGRIKRVFLQGEAKSRMTPADLMKWYIKNEKGSMVSLSSITSTKWQYGPQKLERFNGLSSVSLQGSGREGVSSGDAIKIIEDLSKKLPKGTAIAWSGLSLEEKETGSKTLFLYTVSMLVVFLSLAALYESWSVPLSVILTIPFGVLGSVVFSFIFKMNNDIYFQIGLLTTIGLCAKNAILIVEFLKEMHDSGTDIKQAAIDALKLRFRPIMMTSLAFLLGILPLAFATGAGSTSQKAIGINIIGGVLCATFIAILFVPLFYILVKKYDKKT